MDAGTAAVLTALITGIVALGASVLAPTIGHFLASRGARANRIRQLRMDRLDAAERCMMLQLDAAMAIADGNLSLAERLLETLRQLPYANPLLVGDVDAAKEWASACAAVLNRLPTHPGAGLQVALLGIRVPKETKSALERARTSILAAFDRQRERVTLDQPLQPLSADEMSTSFRDMTDVQAALARFGAPDDN